MSKCKYCGIEGEWRQTQYGNRLFIGEEMHKCPQYKKPTGPATTTTTTTAPTPPPQQQLQGKEQSNTYVPQGYVQTPSQIPIPQPKPEPAILTQIQTTLEAIQTMLGIMKKDQELMGEKIDKLYHTDKE